MEQIDAIVGKIVKFWYRLPFAKENGMMMRAYTTYGRVEDICRVKDVKPKINGKGVRVKNPTTEGVMVARSSFGDGSFNWKGERVRVPQDDLVAVVYYGKETPIAEFISKVEKKEA